MPTRAQLVTAINALRGRTPLLPIKDLEIADMLQSWLDYYDNSGQIKPETFQAQLTGILSVYDQHVATFKENVLLAGSSQAIAENSAAAAAADRVLTQQFKTQVETLLNNALALSNPQGEWSAANLPALTAVPVAGVNGTYYDITVAGLAPFSGSNFTSGVTQLAVGGKLIKKNATQWFYQGPSDLGLVKATKVEKDIVEQTLVVKPFDKKLNASLANGATYDATTRLLTIPVGSSGLNTYLSVGNNFPATCLNGSIAGDVLLITVLVYENVLNGFASRGGSQLGIVRGDVGFNNTTVPVVTRVNNNYVKYSFQYTLQSADLFLIPVLFITGNIPVAGADVKIKLVDVSIENLSKATKVNKLSETIADAISIGSREVVGTTYIPTRAGSFIPAGVGVYPNFLDAKKSPVFFNVSFSRAGFASWVPADVSEFSWTDANGVTRPFVFVDARYWGLIAGDIAVAEDYARNSYLTATMSPTIRININGPVINDWIADVKFFGPDNISISRTGFKPVNVNIPVPLPTLVVLDTDPSVVFVGNPVDGFTKVVDEAIDISRFIDKKLKLSGSSPVSKIRNVDAAGGTDLMNLNIKRVAAAEWNLSDIKSISLVGEVTGTVIPITLVKGSYWGDAGTVQVAAGTEWARSSVQFPVSENAYKVVIKFANSAKYNDFEYKVKFMKGTVLRRQSAWADPFELPLESGLVNYPSLVELLTTEAAGDKVINVKGKFLDVNPSLQMKEGFKIKGQGMGTTIWTIENAWNINSSINGFFQQVNSSISDMTIISVEDNEIVPSWNQPTYAIHTDGGASGINTRLERVRLQSKVKNPALPGTKSIASSPNSLSSIAYGMGFWESQVIEVIDSIIEGQNIHYVPVGECKTAVNAHNKPTGDAELIPGRFSAKNTSFLGGFATVVVSDVNYANELDQNRNRSLWEFTSCYIEVFKLQSFSALTGARPGRKNSAIFNCAGTNIDLILDADEFVNTDLANYESVSLPMVPGVQYMYVTGASDINWGDPVCYVYETRKAHYYRAQEVAVSVPVRIEKLNATNAKNFAGFSLTNSKVGKFAHIRSKGKVATTSVVGAVGDFLAISPAGVLEVVTAGIPLMKVVGKYTTNQVIVEIL